MKQRPNKLKWNNTLWKISAFYGMEPIWVVQIAVNFVTGKPIMCQCFIWNQSGKVFIRLRKYRSWYQCAGCRPFVPIRAMRADYPHGFIRRTFALLWCPHPGGIWSSSWVTAWSGWRTFSGSSHCRTCGISCHGKPDSFSVWPVSKCYGPFARGVSGVLQKYGNRTRFIIVRG